MKIPLWVLITGGVIVIGKILYLVFGGDEKGGKV
jgi:hypothetical protein